MEINLVQDLTMLVLSSLRLDCPVLSGNMKTFIALEEVSQDEITISISGPSYDLNQWRKTGQIIHDDKYDYAVSVNDKGAFNGKSKKSKHWANKSIVKACRIKANEWGAEVVNHLNIT